MADTIERTAIAPQGLEEPDQYWAVWWHEFQRPSIAPDSDQPDYGWLGLHAHRDDAETTRANLMRHHSLKESAVRLKSLTLDEGFDLARNLPRPIETIGRSPFQGLLGLIIIERDPNGRLTAHFLRV